jgi:tetratricopeptide (TPR) repeat protein
VPALPAPPASPSPSAPEPRQAAPAEQPSDAASPAPVQLQAFEQAQRARALAAAQQERWADALWAWDVVLALKPQDPTALSQRAAVQAAAKAATEQRQARARQARQRGDAESALRAYLEVLAIDPLDRTAADGLREIERQRTQRGNVLAQRPSLGWAAARPGPSAPGGTASADPAEDQALEHASLLATQGDMDAAIALLRAHASGSRASPNAKAALGELYWRQAQLAEAQGDRQKALSALRQCLQWAPGHRLASARLAALGGPPAAAPSNIPAALQPAAPSQAAPARTPR